MFPCQITTAVAGLRLISLEKLIGFSWKCYPSCIFGQKNPIKFRKSSKSGSGCYVHCTWYDSVISPTRVWWPRPWRRTMTRRMHCSF